jgi:hypothetical protein
VPSHGHYSLDELEHREYGVMADLDPRLQRLIVRSLEDRTLAVVAKPEPRSLRGSLTCAPGPSTEA